MHTQWREFGTAFAGYFCGTEGQVDEETIRKYVENQGSEEEKNFTIVDG